MTSMTERLHKNIFHDWKGAGKLWLCQWIRWICLLSLLSNQRPIINVVQILMPPFICILNYSHYSVTLVRHTLTKCDTTHTITVLGWCIWTSFNQSHTLFLLSSLLWRHMVIYTLGLWGFICSKCMLSGHCLPQLSVCVHIYLVFRKL